MDGLEDQGGSNPRPDCHRRSCCIRIGRNQLSTLFPRDGYYAEGHFTKRRAVPERRLNPINLSSSSGWIVHRQDGAWLLLIREIFYFEMIDTVCRLRTRTCWQRAIVIRPARCHIGSQRPEVNCSPEQNGKNAGCENRFFFHTLPDYPWRLAKSLSQQSS